MVFAKIAAGIFGIILLTGCVSALETPSALPPPSLPIATGVPVTPRPNYTRTAQALLPTATVEIKPTPADASVMFAPAAEALKNYQPPESDPQTLYDALARGASDFLSVTANGDVSLEGQPALEQLHQALTQIPGLPTEPQIQIAALHTGDDQGGSRDLVFIALQNSLGLPIIALERLGASYTPLPPLALEDATTAENRNFYAGTLEARDVTGDDQKELIYTLVVPGASGITKELTIARWLSDKNTLHPIFRAALIDWAGESDYHFETTADAASLKLTFPWFGAFDHKLLAHPTATETWEYDDAQDEFVRVQLDIENAKTPREQLNAAEYLFRNGDLGGAVNAYERAWADDTLQAEDFGESKADPQAFAKFRQALLLGLLGRDADAKKLLSEARASGDALAQLVQVYAKNSSGKDGALRGWIAMANAGDLYELIFESKAGNLDFPFDAGEVYAVGAVVSTYLNLYGDAAKNPEAVWSALQAFGYKAPSHVSADLNGDGVNEFLFVTEEGGASPNKAQELWLVYYKDKSWRMRALDLADTLTLHGETFALSNGAARAAKYKLPDAYTPNQVALTWDGRRVIWLDAETLQPSVNANSVSVGGGTLEDDF